VGAVALAEAACGEVAEADLHLHLAGTVDPLDD
jgi:hypothetical protein